MKIESLWRIHFIPFALIIDEDNFGIIILNFGITFWEKDRVHKDFM